MICSLANRLSFDMFYKYYVEKGAALTNILQYLTGGSNGFSN